MALQRKYGRGKIILLRGVFLVITGVWNDSHALFYEFGYYKNHLLEIILPFGKRES